MLQKYQKFIKLSHYSQVDFYSSHSRALNQKVLIKRIPDTMPWNDLLTHPHLTLMHKSKHSPKIIQIFKHKAYTFIVFEQPTGSCLAPDSDIQAMDSDRFMVSFAQMLQAINQIKQVSHRVPVVYPQWVFLHRNSLKIAHFSPFLTNQQTNYTHVATRRRSTQNPQKKQTISTQDQIIPAQYQKNSVFHLGLIAYKLLIGHRHSSVSSRQQYEQMVEHIQTNCQRQLLKMVKDRKIVQFVCKMLTLGQHSPNFQQVFNFFTYKSKDIQKNRVVKQLTLDIEIEKIHLKNIRKNKKSVHRVRKCCLKQQQIVHKHNDSKVKQSYKHKSGALYKLPNFLPYISPRNVSCINRHNPFAALYEGINRSQFHKRYDSTRLKTEPY